jgi:hypothetical protein
MERVLGDHRDTTGSVDARIQQPGFVVTKFVTNGTSG